MPTLKEKSEEMARIKGELQRMEDTDDTTEENDGDLPRHPRRAVAAARR